MSYSQLVKSAGKRKMNPKPPARTRPQQRSPTESSSSADSGVSPFRERPSSFLSRRNTRASQSTEEVVDRSPSAPVKRPSLLARTMSGSSSANKSASVSKSRPSSSFLTRKKSGSASNLMTKEDPPPPALERSASARRPSTSTRKAVNTISSPNHRTSSLSRVTMGRGGQPTTPESARRNGERKGTNPDPYETATSPEQAVTALRKKLHDTDRLITACQGKITEYQTKLAMFRAEKLELEMKLSKQEAAMKNVKFPKNSKVQVNLSFDAHNPVWAEATVVEHDQVHGTFVLVVENFGEVDSVPEDKVRHIALVQEDDKVVEFGDSFQVGMQIEINTGMDSSGKKTWAKGSVHKYNSETDTYDIMIENQGIVEEVPRQGLRAFQA